MEKRDELKNELKTLTDRGVEIDKQIHGILFPENGKVIDKGTDILKEDKRLQRLRKESLEVTERKRGIIQQLYELRKASPKRD